MLAMAMHLQLRPASSHRWAAASASVLEPPASGVSTTITEWPASDVVVGEVVVGEVVVGEVVEESGVRSIAPRETSCEHAASDSENPRMTLLRIGIKYLVSTRTQVET